EQITKKGPAALLAALFLVKVPKGKGKRESAAPVKGRRKEQLATTPRSSRRPVRAVIRLAGVFRRAAAAASVAVRAAARPLLL
ncbi:unnamed protein product, partial [Urochloa humidicola]